MPQASATGDTASKSLAARASVIVASDVKFGESTPRCER
jgi:hypothetical protein